MKVLLLLIVVAASVCEIHGDESWNEDELKREFAIYRQQIRLIYDQYSQECPELFQIRPKRGLTKAILATSVEVQKKHYELLIKKIVECRQNKSMTTTQKVRPTTTVKISTTPRVITTTTKATTTVADTTTFVSNMTTQANQIIQECLIAENFTDAWRLEHNGANLKPGPGYPSEYACDFTSSTGWFRFTGDAGNRMLNKCPLYESCGSTTPYWTDAPMPTEVGVKTRVEAYGSISDGTFNCKSYLAQLDVIRCSLDTEHDLVYKYIPKDYYYTSCSNAFCGMQ